MHLVRGFYGAEDFDGGDLSGDFFAGDFAGYRTHKLLHLGKNNEKYV